MIRGNPPLSSREARSSGREPDLAPPVIAPRRRRDGRRIASELLLWASAAAAGRAAMHWSRLLPPCGWKLLLGIPCPFCGGTRALDALSRGELERAFFLNPLVTSAMMGALAWAMFRLTAPERARVWRRRAGQWLEGGWRFGAAMALALGANWVYLYYFLPR